jgi:rhodanese-related sulfurtransferase
MHGLWVKYSPRPLSRQGRGFFTQRLTLQISRSVHGNESSWLLIESQEELEGSRMGVVLALICVVVIIVSLTTVLWKKQSRDQRWTMEQHAISPEQLYSLLGSHQDVALFDVRQPLDLLAHSEIIPGARRIPPADVLTAPSLIPKDKEAIVYCTCPGDKTSRAVLRRALDLQFFKIKFLKGGFEAWKAKGYPVEPYREVFHLYSPNLVQH